MKVRPGVFRDILRLSNTKIIAQQGNYRGVLRIASALRFKSYEEGFV
jgi:hypothetical protein